MTSATSAPCLPAKAATATSRPSISRSSANSRPAREVFIRIRQFVDGQREIPASARALVPGNWRGMPGAEWKPENSRDIPEVHQRYTRDIPEVHLIQAGSTPDHLHTFPLYSRLAPASHFQPRPYLPARISASARLHRTTSKHASRFFGSRFKVQGSRFEVPSPIPAILHRPFSILAPAAFPAFSHSLIH